MVWSETAITGARYEDAQARAILWLGHLEAVNPNYGGLAGLMESAARAELFAANNVAESAQTQAVRVEVAPRFVAAFISKLAEEALAKGRGEVRLGLALNRRALEIPPLTLAA